MSNRRTGKLDAGEDRDRPHEIRALEDEIVRIAAYIRTKQAELVRLRTRYDELAKKPRGSNR